MRESSPFLLGGVCNWKASVTVMEVPAAAPVSAQKCLLVLLGTQIVPVPPETEPLGLCDFFFQLRSLLLVSPYCPLSVSLLLCHLVGLNI